MDVNVALLADYANVTREQKLNVMGIFREINASNLPAVHSQMHLIIMWEATRAESGRKKEIEIQLRDADGKKMFSLDGVFEVPMGASGRKIFGQHIVVLNGLKFEKSGLYAFHILIGDDDKGSAEFEVKMTPPIKKG